MRPSYARTVVGTNRSHQLLVHLHNDVRCADKLRVVSGRTLNDDGKVALDDEVKRVTNMRHFLIGRLLGNRNNNVVVVDCENSVTKVTTVRIEDFDDRNTVPRSNLEPTVNLCGIVSHLWL